MKKAKKAVVLLSGGLDSATALYMALARGYECHCLTFDYGQRHKREIKSAAAIAKGRKSGYRIVRLEFPWNGSALLDKDMVLPERGIKEIMREGIPATYVPARNVIFLSIAAGYAEAIGAGAIFIGANSRDYSGYPDCRGRFFKAFAAALKAGTRAGCESSGIKIQVPLIRMSKAEIIKAGMRLKVPYGLTWSCYRGGRRPCGRCDSCRLRAKGFKEAGAKDPLTDG